MKAPFLCIVFILLGFSSCGKRGGPPRLEGAWLGEGTFSVSAGSKDVKAQLEILPDGSYRFLFLEPGILMMSGMEQGVWTREGEVLTLTPGDGKSDEETAEEEGVKDGVFETLRKSPPKNLRVKQLKIGDDLGSMTMSDGPLELEFTPNPEATRKLEQAGDLNEK